MDGADVDGEHGRKRPRRHFRKTIAEIAAENIAIAAGHAVPASRKPKLTRKLGARMEALRRPCPKCGAEAGASCKAKRPDTLRWSFHRERWQQL